MINEFRRLQITGLQKELLLMKMEIKFLKMLTLFYLNKSIKRNLKKYQLILESIL